MKHLTDILHGIGFMSVVILAGIVAIYAVLIAAGILAHWLANIFMFGWHLL